MAWKVRRAGWAPPRRLGTAPATMAASSDVDLIGPRCLARTIARTIRRECRSSPYRKITSASRCSGYPFTTSDAVGPSSPMRMSSGASER